MSQKDVQNAYKDGPFRGPGLDDIASKIDEILQNAIKKAEAQVEVIKSANNTESESANMVASITKETNEYNKIKNDVINGLRETFKLQKSIDEVNAEIVALEAQKEYYSYTIEQLKEQTAETNKQIEKLTAENKKQYNTLAHAEKELNSIEKQYVANEQTKAMFQAVCDLRAKDVEARRKIVEILAKKNPHIPIDIDNSDMLAAVRLVAAANKLDIKQ